ncbi:MAG: 1-deoxy-D-xylulose-5-phosphate reductoisomerase, partial [Clostridia bacterium]|nr:1-deoxy-D-xylulose-5-phosphate reductoisomerase [Clostridia bacterium]
MRSISVLGSTGSIGTQALELVKAYPEEFRIEALCARQNAQLLFEQVRTFRPRVAALTGIQTEVPDDLKRGCEWLFGEEALEQLARFAPADDVLVSVSGMVGLKAVLCARQAK